MNVEELNDDMKIFKLMNKPVPPDFSELSYVGKLRFVPSIYFKRKILRERANTPLEVTKNELCVFTPGLHMEYLRCTNLEKMETFISTMKTPVIELKLSGIAPVIGIRVGESMAKLLHDRCVQLKIVDIYANEILIPNIETTFIRNKQFSR